MKMPSPVILEGLLYMGIAFFSFWQTALGSDAAVKIIGPHVLFWLQMTVGSSAATLLALKMFRSTAFADSRPSNGNGQHQQTPEAK